MQPSKDPSSSPSMQPSKDPSPTPSLEPSLAPSDKPSIFPSHDPTNVPSLKPSDQPTVVPTYKPTSTPSIEPSLSIQPTGTPSTLPSSYPSQSPSKAAFIESFLIIELTESTNNRDVTNITSIEHGVASSLQQVFVIEGVSTFVSCEVIGAYTNNIQALCKIEQTALYVGANLMSSDDLWTLADEQSISLALSLQSSLGIESVTMAVKALEPPSAAPSVGLSSNPNISLYPTTTSKPTGPSPEPTRSPTHYPSLKPSASQDPTIHPSITPSLSSNPSHAPSLQPSHYPSSFPSMFQSQFDGKECRFDIECASERCDRNTCSSGVSIFCPKVCLMCIFKVFL
jgi:hypothetical protein